MTWSLWILLFGVCVLMKRAERQRRADALEASQLAFDALPDDAKERVRQCRRERTGAVEATIEAKIEANKADLGQQVKLAVVLVAAALVFNAVVALFSH